MIFGKWIYLLWVGVKYGESFFLFGKIDGLCINRFLYNTFMLNKILVVVNRLINFKYSGFVS